LLRCVIRTRYRNKYCAGITPDIAILPLTIHYLAGILKKYKQQKILPALSEKSMQSTVNSDPKAVRVRSGNVSSERVRERLAEESVCITCPEMRRKY